jgi:hypothetical protein
MRRLIPFVLLLLVFPVYAGSARLVWDPVPDADLAGYEVAYEVAPALGDCAAVPSPGAPVETFGAVTEVVVTGLTDCAPYCFWVRAFDLAGQRSLGWSNWVDNWPNPYLTEAPDPQQWEVAGVFEGVALVGGNFRPGMAVAAFITDTSDLVPGITIDTVTVPSCNAAGFNVTVAADMLPGTYDLAIWLPEATEDECCDTCDDRCTGTFTTITVTNDPPTEVMRLRRLFRK